MTGLFELSQIAVDNQKLKSHSSWKQVEYLESRCQYLNLRALGRYI